MIANIPEITVFKNEVAANILETIGSCSGYIIWPPGQGSCVQIQLQSSEIQIQHSSTVMHTTVWSDILLSRLIHYCLVWNTVRSDILLSGLIISCKLLFLIALLETECRTEAVGGDNESSLISPWPALRIRNVALQKNRPCINKNIQIQRSECERKLVIEINMRQVKYCIHIKRHNILIKSIQEGGEQEVDNNISGKRWTNSRLSECSTRVRNGVVNQGQK